MKNISLKLQDQILQETEVLLQYLKTSRNKYINEAVSYYNQYHKRKLLEKQLVEESKILYKNSMSVLHEFGKIEDDYEAI